VAIGLQRKSAALLGAVPSRVHPDHVGLDHLTRETAVRLDGPAGEDVLPGLLTAHGETIAAGLRLPLLTRLGTVPSSYPRYHYAHDEVVGEQRAKRSRATEVAALAGELPSRYADPSPRPRRRPARRPRPRPGAGAPAWGPHSSVRTASTRPRDAQDRWRRYHA